MCSIHLSLCPVHVSIHTTSDGKASSSVRLDVLDFHLDSTSNSVHSCNLSISRCSIPRHARKVCSARASRNIAIARASITPRTHYLDAIAKSQTKPKPLLMKRKISLASRCWSHTVKPEVSPVRSTDATSEAFRSPHPLSACDAMINHRGNIALARARKTDTASPNAVLLPTAVTRLAGGYACAPQQGKTFRTDSTAFFACTGEEPKPAIYPNGSPNNKSQAKQTTISLASTSSRKLRGTSPKTFFDDVFFRHVCGGYG